MEKIQKEFEVWAIEHHFSTAKKTDGASYAHDSTMCAFEGWQASRSALCVELPHSWIAGELGDDANVFEVVDVMTSLNEAGVSYK